MKRLLLGSAALALLLFLTIMAATIVENAASELHLQRLSAAFSTGICDQPCWRGIQVEKIGLVGMLGAIQMLPDVTPASSAECPGCWLIVVEGIRWQGKANATGNQIVFDTLNTQSNFRLADAVELFGLPISISCVILSGATLSNGHVDLSYTMGLEFENGVDITSRYHLDHFNNYLDPMSMVNEVVYQQPMSFYASSILPWRGFTHIPPSKCHFPGG